MSAEGKRKWEAVHHVALPNTPKLKRGGQEGKRAAAGASAAPAAHSCDGRMPGPLSLAAHSLGALIVPTGQLTTIKNATPFRDLY